MAFIEPPAKQLVKFARAASAPPAQALQLRIGIAHRQNQLRRSTMSFLISAIALAGLRPFGQVRVQFMMVWQR